MNNIRLSDKLFHVIAGLYILVVIVITVQALVLQRKTAPGKAVEYTKYNNYVIYQRSHFHLLDGKNLYKPYPGEQIDLFKYSPTFAFLFGGIASLPDWIGLMLWNLLNIIVFLFAIWYLPALDLKKKALILLLSASDIIISIQNSQSNVLVAGLLVCGFALFEKKQYFLAVLCIMTTFYIKIFGIAVLLIFLMYPGRFKTVLYAIGSFLLLGLLPLPFIGFEHLKTAYLQYFDLLKMDQSVSQGLSVMGGLKVWFNLTLSNWVVVSSTFILMSIPLFMLKKLPEYTYRLLFFTALMIWMIIFNYRAESPSFIIATVGIFIWFLSWKAKTMDVVLLCLVVLFTSLSSTDIFPPDLRENYLEPYVVKVVPCIIVWVRVLVDLYKMKGLTRNA